MPTYAADTNVSAEASRAEIERTLQRYGAEQFMYGWDRNAAVVGFVMAGRQIRLRVELPDRGADEFWYTPKRRTRRDADAAYKAWEQGCRQRWRALALLVTAKLEAVEAGIETFDEAFLAHIMLPNGTTAGAWLGPQIDEAYETGTMPALLPALGTGETD